MCLILLGTKENLLKQPLNRAWDMNPHGAGVIFLGEKASVIKGVMTWKGLSTLVKNAPTGQTLAIHFRQATHGSVCQKWTHPFPAGSGCFLMHNGILPHLGKSGQNGSSDSAHLARILCRLNIEDKLALLSSLASSSRFLLVRGLTYWRFGSWSEHGGCHHSNGLLVPVRYTWTPTDRDINRWALRTANDDPPSAQSDLY